MKRKSILVRYYLTFSLLLLLSFIDKANASNRLIFLETQGITGYSPKKSQPIFFSKHKNETMQKPSIGFDYIEKLANDKRDLATIAIQGRLAYDNAYSKWEPQLYNAYLETKTSIGGDFWIGSNRPAFSINSYLDNHSELLQPLSMYGFGFGRDWGLGYTKYLENGDLKASLTNGSGQQIKTKGNYLASIRYSKGVLNFDNYNIGFSIANGKTLKSMGYHISDDSPKDLNMFGIDASYNFNNIEQKGEFIIGEKQDVSSFGAMYRLGFKFLDDDKLKFEIQPVYAKTGKAYQKTIGTSLTYKFSAKTTGRLLFSHTKTREISNNSNLTSSENLFLGQIYYYVRWL